MAGFLDVVAKVAEVGLTVAGRQAFEAVARVTSSRACAWR